MTRPGPVSDELRAELKRAFSEYRPRFGELVEDSAALDPDPLADKLGDEAIEQFINAYEAMFNEALDGTGRDVRELVFASALEPVMEMGQTAASLVRSNVISAVLLTYRLLAIVREDLRDEAAMWLAGYFSQYTSELAEQARAIEAAKR